MDHLIGGREAIKIASENGYDFEANKVGDGKFYCIFDVDGGSGGFKSDFVINARKSKTFDPALDPDDPAMCRFDLFSGGKKLKNPWKLKALTFTPTMIGKFVYVKTPAYNTNDPHFAIQSIVELKGELTTIVLTGPEGSDWRDAFRP